MLFRFVLLVLLTIASSYTLANQVNLVLNATWGDRHYGTMFSDGNDLYVASDGVIVLDMADATMPIQKAKVVIPESENIRQLKKIGDYLYVMTGKQFYIYDVNDLSAVQLRATIPYGGANYLADFVIKEDILFIMGQDNVTLSIYDITDHSAPVLQRAVPFTPNYSANEIKIALTNKHLLVSFSDEIKLLSLAEDNYLTELYSDTQQSFVRSEIAVSGDIAYFVNQNLLIIYDFSNPEQVTKSTVEFEDISYQYKDMNIDGSHLNILGSYIHKFDLTSPTEPTLLYKSSNTYHEYTYLTSLDDYIVISNREEILTLSGSTLISEYSKSAYVQDFSASENMLASASGKWLQLFDLSNNNFDKVYESEWGYHSSVLLNDHYMYTANNVIYDFEDIENIRPVGSFYHDNGGSILTQLEVNDGKLSSRSYSKITNFDMPTPLAPIELNEIDVSTLTNGTTSQSTGMAVKNGHYFIGTTKGLYHFYQEENNDLKVVGLLGEAQWISELKIVENHLYILISDGLEVWDISNISTPSLIKTLPIFGLNNHGLLVYKTWLFIPSSNAGVSVVDIKNPEMAAVIANLNVDNIFFPYGGVIQGRNLIVADWGQLKRFEINEAPTIVTDSLTTNEDITLTDQLDVVNIEQDELSFEIVTEPTNGTISVSSTGEVIYQPEDNFNGTDIFTVKVTDQYGGESEKSILITIFSANDVPVAESLTTSVNHNDTISNRLATTDVDGDVLEYSVIDDATNGTISLSSVGEYTYTPNSGYSGSDSFTYEVTDGKNTVQGTITFSVKAAPPVVKAEKSSGGGSMGYLFILILFGVLGLRRNR